MKKFVGYNILGAANKDEAETQHGLLVWMTKKPGWFKRKMLKSFFGIFWIDRARELQSAGIKERPENNTSFNKFVQPKTPRVKYEYKKRNSEESTRS